MSKFIMQVCMIVMFVLLWFFSAMYLAETPENILAYSAGCICSALIMILMHEDD